MVLKNTYGYTAAPTATYDWQDLASGTGYILFYGGDDVDGDYALSNKPFNSHHLYTTASTVVEGTPTKVIDIDFDATLNYPMRVSGRVILEVPLAQSGVARGDPGDSWAYIIAKLRRWDGTTEHELGNDQTDTLNSKDGLVDYNTATLFIDVAQEDFNVGDVLRVTIEGYAWCTTTAAKLSHVYCGHDPNARSSDYQFTAFVWSASYSSRLLLQLPVRVVQ